MNPADTTQDTSQAAGLGDLDRQTAPSRRGPEPSTSDPSGRERPVSDRYAADLRSLFALSRAMFGSRDESEVDDIVLFKPLSEPQIERIVELQFDELRRRLAERRISVELTEAAREVIAHDGYDPVFGARPLRRFISHEVETMIGRALLRGDVQDGATVRVDAQHSELVVTYDQPEQPGMREAA